MRKALLCNKVRKMLDNDYALKRIHLELEEYSSIEIKEAIDEYYRDESTLKDDMLIDIIESGMRSGKNVDAIANELVRDGHNLHEIQKAILRTSNDRGSYIKWKLKNSPKIFNTYYALFLSIFLISVLLAIFYNFAFASGAFITAFMFIMSLTPYPKQAMEGKTDTSILPGPGHGLGGGIFITQGHWGWRPNGGSYFRWWTLRPGIILTSFFSLLMIIGFTLFGAIFAIFAGSLALASLALLVSRPSKVQYMKDNENLR